MSVPRILIPKRKTQPGEVQSWVSATKIQEDMRKRHLKFDLSSEDDYTREDGAFIHGRKWCFENPNEFWKQLENTDNIKVPDKFEDWLVGQDRALEEVRQSMHEWIRKLQYIADLRKKKVRLSQILREMPGPYVLMIGAPGTGKSLIIKIVAEDLKRLYEENNIKLNDVLLMKNKYNRYHPHVRIVPAGMGRRMLAEAERREIRKGRIKQIALISLMMVFVVIGIAMMSSGLFLLFSTLWSQGLLEGWFLYAPKILSIWFIIGMFLVIFPLFILLGGMGMGSGGGILGRKTETFENIPNMLVDNGGEPKLYIDATVTNITKLMGDVEWSPWGEAPGLAKPAHRRLVAGDVHRADKKLLYLDEIRNMTEQMAVELLTVMEDSAAPIRGHAAAYGGHTASQNVESESIPACFALLCAGNEDVIWSPHSIINRVPALRDRFNYGNIIYMQDEMDATLQNEIKVAQVFTDEIYRFNLPPITKDGVKLLIEQMKRRASSNKKMKIMFRSVIKVIKKSAQLAWVANSPVIAEEHVRLAIDEYTKPVMVQIIEQDFEKHRPHKLVRTGGARVGRVNGLAVVNDPSSGEGGGDVFPIAVWMQKVDKHEKADFILTGINEQTNTWVADSKRAVRTTIYKLYGIDIGKDYYAHVAFLQQRGVDGPSAGITMTLAIMSVLGDPTLPPEQRKPIPLRQDIAMTGAIEIADEKGTPVVSAVGGIYEKVTGANRWGLKMVLIPMTNYENNVDEAMKKLPIKIVGCKTLQDYLTMARGEKMKGDEDE